MKKKDIYRQLRDKGYTFQQIADQFGISRQAVQIALNSATEKFRKYRRLLYATNKKYRIRRKKYYMKNKEYYKEYNKQHYIKRNLVKHL